VEQATMASETARARSRGRAARGCPFGGLVLLSLALLAAPGAHAQQASPLPDFTGERVVVGRDVPNRDRYDSLRPIVAGLEASSPQTYYVVVVERAGSGSQATRRYADALFEKWVAQAGPGGVKIDPERSVLIVMARQNRQISVRPGSVLQGALGMRSATIDREIVQPSFVPLAKAEKYPEALTALLRSADAWIAARDKETRAYQEQSQRRAEQLRKDADQAIIGARLLADEARKERDEKAAAGFDVGFANERLDRAGAAINTLPPRLDTETAAVLREGQQVQHELEQVTTQLRQLPNVQARARAALEQADATEKEVEDAIAAAVTARLPVGPVQASLQQALALREGARKALGTVPAAALEGAEAFATRLTAIKAEVAALPELHRQKVDAAGRFRQLDRALTGAIADAESAGTDIADLRATIDPLRKQAAAAAEDNEDDRASLQTLQTAITKLGGAADEIRDRIRSHRFNTRTLPLGTLGAAGAAALAGLGLVRYRHLRAKDSAGEEFKEFRTRATEMMERLDVLKERHKALPVADPDFKEPMSGETLRVYNQVEGNLKTLWDRWLEIMDSLERAQGLMRQQSTLGTEQFEQAKELLKKQGSFEEVQKREAACKTDLDRLNRAHEDARALMEALAAEGTRLQQQLETLAASGLTTAPFQKDLAGVEVIRGKGAQVLTPDPLGARAQLEQARERTAALLERSDEVLGRLKAAQKTLADIDVVQGTAAGHRAKGLRLDEPKGNPDPLLDQARRAHAEAIAALHAANPAGAGEALARAEGLRAEAAGRIAAVVAAKDALQAAIPERQEEARKVVAAVEEAAATLEDIRRHFAPGSWQDLATTVDDLRGLVATTDERLGQVANLNTDKAQRYLEAQAIVQALAQQQELALRRAAALPQRRDALVKLRAETQAEHARQIDRARRLTALIGRTPEAIGPEAQGAFEAARTALDGIHGATTDERPDWPALARELAEAAEGLAIAEERAEADVKAYQEVLARFEHARERAETVGAMLQRERADRPAANQRYRTGIEAIGRVSEAMRSARGGWDRILATLKDAVADIDRAEGMAQEDIRLAQQAESEFGQAARSLRQAQAFVSLGVTADAAEADRTLQQAGRAYKQLEYEQAIRLANAADKSAREALHAAESEVGRRQWQLDAARRRRDAGRRNFPGAGGGIDLGPMFGGMIGGVLMDAMRNAGQGGSTFGGGGGSWGGFGGGGDSGGDSGAGGDWGAGGGDSGTSESSW
jgi:uncharacterized membrane protein YgcG